MSVTRVCHYGKEFPYGIARTRVLTC